MIELKGDIFDYADNVDNNVDALCVLTNMTVKYGGKLIMGGGQALAAAKKFPALPVIWGAATLLLEHEAYGRVTIVTDQTVIPAYSNLKYHLVSFPTKTNPSNPSSLELIQKAANELVKIADLRQWNNIVLPRPGCGLGGLDWYKDVRPAIERVLDNRFKVMTF